MGTCIEFNFKELYEKDYNIRSGGEIPALWHYTNAEGLMGVIRNDKAERANTRRSVGMTVRFGSRSCR